MEVIDLSNYVPSLGPNGDVILPAMTIDDQSCAEMSSYINELSKSAYHSGNHTDAIALAVVRAILVVSHAQMTAANIVIEVNKLASANIN